MGSTGGSHDRGGTPVVWNGFAFLPRSASRFASAVVVGLLVLGGLGIASAGGTRNAPFPSSPPTLLNERATPGPQGGAFVGTRINDLPEFFVSPITGASYRIVKDEARGSYAFCDAGGICKTSLEAILDAEASTLPAWARVVEPALREQVLEVRAGSRPDGTVGVIIELRDDTFAMVSSETWGRADGDLRTLESLAAAAPQGTAADRAVLDRINAIADSAKREIYARAELDLSPLIAETRVRIESGGGQFTGYTPVLPAVFARVLLASIPAIAADPKVSRISEDRPVHIEMDVSAYAIHADTWWTNGYTGGPWRAAVEDTGVDATHPAFAPVNIQSSVFHATAQTSACYADQPTNPDDLYGHGTHVAGTVASNDARYRGVAFGLDTLINTKAGWLVSGACGGGGEMVPSDGMLGVDWAVNTAGADVISLSFGGNPGAGDTAWERFFDAVVDGLHVAVAIAAGNSGSGSGTVTDPGAAFNILSVGAINDMNTVGRADDLIAWFSSRGPTGDGRLKPDIVAPGYDITSTNAFWESGPDFISFSGTSMATPHIAASHILLMNGIGSTFPPLYKALLLNSAEDRGTTGPDTTYGWGYVDLAAAYNQRNRVLEGNVSDAPVRYTFFRGPALAGDRATIVWNRHVQYIGPRYPTTVYGLNDLDLFSYDENGGSRIAASTRTVDNVEQVVSGGSVASTVYKVKVAGTGSLAGVTQEHFALAAPAATGPIAAPALRATMSVPGSQELGSVFTVSSDVADTGGLRAHNVLVTLTLPAGLTLVSGANPQSLGSIPAGSTRTATWQVRGDQMGTQSLSATAASVSYEENFSAGSGTYTVGIVDSTFPVSSVSALPAYETTASFPVTATASDLGGVRTVELFYRMDGGLNSSAGVDATAPWSWTFDSATHGGDGTYDFYSIATDLASNREAAPAAPDASTLVDSAPPTSLLNPLPQYVTTPTLTLTATASDSGSGVSSVSVYYRAAGGAWTFLGTDTAAPWSWTFDSALTGGDGAYEFYAVATDNIGNVEPKASAPEASTTIDTLAPTTGTNPAGTQGRNGWYTSDVVVRLVPLDGGSGVASTSYRLDGGSWQSYSAPFWVRGDGTHSVEYFSTDRAGNQEGTQRLDVGIDTRPPVSTHVLGGTLGNAGWYTTDVTVTLTASDETSGVNVTYYQLDGGLWKVYTGPLQATGDGVHSLTFYSADMAGNEEVAPLVQFRIDATPPRSVDSLSGRVGGGGWYTSSVSVSLSASDGGSGVAIIEYQSDGGGWQAYASGIPVSADGHHTVEYRSTDIAGNVEGVRQVEFQIDTRPPDVAISSPGSGSVFQSSSVRLDWTASDDGSGLAACTAAMDGATPLNVSGANSRLFADVPDGSHSAMVRCTDVAGQASTARVDFSIDTNPFSLRGGFGSLLPLILIALAVVATAVFVVVLARRRRKDDDVNGPARSEGRITPPPPPPPDDLLPPPP